MKRFALFLLLLVLMNETAAQELILEDAIAAEKSSPGEGIWVEKPTPRDTSEHKYTRDNISYKLGKLLLYDYYYQGKSGIKKKFLPQNQGNPDDNPMHLCDYTASDSNAIDQVMLAVTDLRSTYPQCDSGCTQTTIAYSYLTKSKLHYSGCGELTIKKNGPYFFCETVSTGVVDNKKNIWIHPPRQFSFKILQLNPFPFYYFDESIKEWAYNVEVGGNYLDPRWIAAKENIVLRLSYKRAGDEEVSTPFGNFLCKVVNATGTSRFAGTIIKTKLKSYYHPLYGFVRLEYINADGSIIVIQLVETASEKNG